MSSTMFYLDGKPVSAEEFIKKLFDTLKLPEILGGEDELRQLWSNPITRSELISKLEKHGCGKEDLNKLRELINAENSDLFDVLQYIAFSNPALTRKERVESAEDNIYKFIDKKQIEFIRFVLNNYIKEGHCGTCLEDLKECAKHCQKPNECKIVNDKYKCILPKDDKFFICKYIHIPFLCN